jgi:RimJ/RimL family protein N-acetyltransferase
VTLETARTRLRPWRPEDADRFLDTYSRWEVARWLGSTPSLLRTHADAVERIERWASRATTDPDRGLWAIERKDDGTVAGTVLLVPVPDAHDGAIEIGWHLHPDAWGHGFATEAAKAVLDRAFAQGLPEVIAVVKPGNDPSMRVAERIGLRHEGVTDRYYSTTMELFRLASPVAGERPGAD